MTGRLEGKIALITGVGGGMGVAAARRFAAEGAKVAGCDLDRDGAARTEELVRGEGGEITVSGGVDLGDPDAARAWVDAAVATYDGLLAAGAASRMPPGPSPEPGVRIAFVADPEGNLIELLDRS